MSTLNSNLIVTGVFFIFIFLSGFWLKNTGKPYSMLIITLHKLIALAAGIYLGRTVYRIHQETPLNTARVVVVAVTVLLFVVNVATGSLLSAEKPMPQIVSSLNKYIPYLTVISTAVMVYLLR